MTPQTIRILTECEVMLTETAQRYALARRRLAEVEPGFAAHTPGAGEPGCGKGFTAGSITERLAERPHLEITTALWVTQGPDIIAANAAYFAGMLNLPRPNTTNSPRRAIQLLAWTRWIIRQLLATETDPPSTQLDILHRSIIQLHQTVNTWGRQPEKPAKPQDTALLADDLTGQWCRSCLRVGVRNPRYRGDLDRWCYEFLGAERFIPPTDIIEARASGKRITDNMVEPHRKAFRERNKNKKRKRAS